MPRDKGLRAELDALSFAPEGEVRAVVRCGGTLATLATLAVSLRARPVESYLRVLGENGPVTADFILGAVIALAGPGASSPAVVLKPLSQAWIAISTYVLVAIVRKRLRLDLSMYEILQILSLTLFEKIPLPELLTRAALRPISPPIDNQLNLLD